VPTGAIAGVEYAGGAGAIDGPLTGVPQTLQNDVPSINRAPHFEQNTVASFRC
jgi:hypothetical protein